MQKSYKRLSRLHFYMLTTINKNLGFFQDIKQSPIRKTNSKRRKILHEEKDNIMTITRLSLASKRWGKKKKSVCPQKGIKSYRGKSPEGWRGWASQSALSELGNTSALRSWARGCTGPAPPLPPCQRCLNNQHKNRPETAASIHSSRNSSGIFMPWIWHVGVDVQARAPVTATSRGCAPFCLSAFLDLSPHSLPRESHKPPPSRFEVWTRYHTAVSKGNTPTNWPEVLGTQTGN